MSEEVDALLSLFDLEPTRDDAFLGQVTRGGGRLFGGLVLAQALIAAGRTTDGISPHSLHAYFLRPGRPGEPIAYDVLRLKQGRNFHARGVTARQGDDVIFTMQASFTRPEPGFSHQDPMPKAPDPETLSPSDHWGRRGGHHGAIQSRSCEADADEEPLAPRQSMWMRPVSPLPEDPLIHAAALVYASDRRLMSTGARPHRGPGRMRRGASLDHAVWFHRTLPFDDWVLFAAESPVAEGGRPLNFAAMYRRDGTRMLSVAQEALVRFSNEPRGW